MEIEVPIIDSKYTTTRINDFYLMDVVKNHGKSEQHKIIFNQVRLSLQLETASDIVVIGSGITIHESVVEGMSIRHSEKIWPKICKYPRTWKKVWQNILKNHVYPLICRNPLGRRICNKKTHQSWTIYMNENKDIMNDGEVYYRRKTRSLLYYPVDNDEELRMDKLQYVYNADVVLKDNGYKLLGVKHKQGAMNGEEMKLEDDISPWINRNWGTLEISPPQYWMLKYNMRKDNLIGASDGSVKDGKGSHSYCITTKDSDQVLVEAVAPVDGHSEFMVSYRAESLGALAIITLLCWIGKRFDIKDGDVQIHVDNMETVQTLLKKKHVKNTVSSLEDNIDVALEVHHQLETSTLKIEGVHVKSTWTM